MNKDAYSLQALQDSVREGVEHDFIFFWRHTTHPEGHIDKTCLSQWYPSPFSVDGIEYPTAEHFMMAGKARLFGDERAVQRILKADSPKAVKQMGREVQGFREDQWHSRRVDIVVEGNLAKFSQHPELRAYLLGTGGCVLVEASPLDKVWGIGLAEDHPDVTNPLAWRGLNLLGFALMTVRDRLAAVDTP